MAVAAGGQDVSGADKMRVLYDGKCPICVFEINWLESKSKKMEGGGDHMAFVDVAAEGGYDPDANGGVSYEDAMRVMTVVRPDGTVSKGMGAFEDMYAAVGMGWVFAFLKYKSLRTAFDSLYDFWARFRLPVTGRGSLEAHLEARECDRDACKARREIDPASARGERVQEGRFLRGQEGDDVILDMWCLG
eukprot:CAMPEP_0174917228 /NCGR_PEP_ID=MMETSP1355-20121228/2330_1 /TAXON_ID=464990 /ORGANISM="Hemiselmis tepida, Strain CCMP443" /LENGTH=189 /DNA_ID=CAMNT_0016162299 /DNA_START=218 /DNA_END=784 /DNA_ORIENTATION=-